MEVDENASLPIDSAATHSGGDRSSRSIPFILHYRRPVDAVGVPMSRMTSNVWIVHAARHNDNNN